MIRLSTDTDLAALERLYAVAFPEESLWPLVTALLKEPQTVSLVADEDGLIGHALYSKGSATDARPALLGPLAVAPDAQRQGWGKRLMAEGATWLFGEGITQILVLGDPAYYGRHGFSAETGIAPPYPLPDEWRGAWQSRMAPGATPGSGTLTLPAPCMEPKYWQP
ncbi:GNAT family N-acetyltransferase [Paracoccaceae bacterium GXU_MW_L88]